MADDPGLPEARQTCAPSKMTCRACPDGPGTRNPRSGAFWKRGAIYVGPGARVGLEADKGCGGRHYKPRFTSRSFPRFLGTCCHRPHPHSPQHRSPHPRRNGRFRLRASRWTASRRIGWPAFVPTTAPHPRPRRSHRTLPARSSPDETTDERVIATGDLSFFPTGVQAGLCSRRAASTILNWSWRND